MELGVCDSQNLLREVEFDPVLMKVWFVRFHEGHDTDGFL